MRFPKCVNDIMFLKMVCLVLLCLYRDVGSIMSGLYIDDGAGHTVMRERMTDRKIGEMKHELTETLGLCTRNSSEKAHKRAE